MMHNSIYVICVALILVSQSEEAVNNNYLDRQLDSTKFAADQEIVSYILPKLVEKYRLRNDWGQISDPKFYILGGMEAENLENQMEKNMRVRNKRYNFESSGPKQSRYYNMEQEPSLSINAPIQSLRKVYAKERLRQRVAANRRFLENLIDSQ